ncbi:hypothetical protein KC343_g9362 [Hortaea werneckii]|nr:hypothetical protein KC323_g8542 [Hortaea werneckii]KAI6869344.1 hypothetical protein KC338_g3516 [Hortaea werneckii]KAI7185993.1 hypothetical protein KC352_g22500 [Hortaea werneckii]KAI7345964.1 hypothetical protein KC320_g8114 [Hortaea werneckii]KAI7560787.1 hypothetical protein KC317_g9505 [Hortaea werneckii]
MPSLDRAFSFEHLDPGGNKSHATPCRVQTPQSLGSPLSFSHAQQTYHVLQLLDYGMFGETYLAIKKQTANKILAAHTNSNSSIEGLYSALREQVIALKLDHIEGGALVGLDLASEIDFMVNQIPYPHPRLLPCIDAHCEDGKAWLATPFCSGGNLMTFCTRHSAPLSFIWHVGLQVAEAIAFLHFGVDEGDAFNGQTGWPVLCHADLYPGNVFLRLASRERHETFGNYPNVVLGDFGCAGSLNGTDNGRRDTVISDRKQDMINIGHLLDVLFKTCMHKDDELVQFIAQFKEYDNFDVADCFFGKALLSDFVQAADRIRREVYEDLCPKVIEDLSQSKVSNHTFDHALGVCSCSEIDDP